MEILTPNLEQCGKHLFSIKSYNLIQYHGSHVFFGVVIVIVPDCTIPPRIQNSNDVLVLKILKNHLLSIFLRYSTVLCQYVYLFFKKNSFLISNWREKIKRTVVLSLIWKNKRRYSFIVPVQYGTVPYRWSSFSK